MIGGATTSAKHTAVKIAPAYKHETVHVLDASRSVGVVEQLLNPESRGGFDAATAREQAQLVESYQQRQQVKLVPYDEAVGAAVQDRLGDGADRRAVVPRPPRAGRLSAGGTAPNSSIGRRSFMAWELKGKYPKIFDDPDVGEEAQRLFDDATQPACSGSFGEKLLHGPRRVWLLAGELVTATTSSSSPTKRARPS